MTQKKGQLERQAQIAFVDWFKERFSSLEFLIAHFANGGKRDIREAYMFKRMGVLAGMPDVGIFVPTELYHGLFIEFKNPLGTGRASPAQRVVMEALRRQNYKVCVAISFEEARAVTEAYLPPKLKERV